MSKMENIEKIRIPKILIVTVPDNRVIHIDDQIFGKLVIKLLNDDKDGVVEGCEVKMPDYSGENGCFITVPKAWIDKKVLVKYERELDAKVLNFVPESWFKDMPHFTSHGQISIDGLTVDYPDEDRVLYSIYFTE